MIPVTTTPPDGPAEAVAKLETDYPGIQIWYGSYTRRYKALAAGQLIEATSAAQLARKLDALAAPRPGP